MFALIKILATPLGVRMRIVSMHGTIDEASHARRRCFTRPMRSARGDVVQPELRVVQLSKPLGPGDWLEPALIQRSWPDDASTRPDPEAKLVEW